MKKCSWTADTKKEFLEKQVHALVDWAMKEGGVKLKTILESKCGDILVNHGVITKNKGVFEILINISLCLAKITVSWALETPITP